MSVYFVSDKLLAENPELVNIETTRLQLDAAGRRKRANALRRSQERCHQPAAIAKIAGTIAQLEDDADSCDRRLQEIAQRPQCDKCICQKCERASDTETGEDLCACHHCHIFGYGRYPRKTCPAPSKRKDINAGEGDDHQ